MFSGLADRIRTSSKSISLIDPIVAAVSANQNRDPADQVQATIMLSAIFAQELGLDLRTELAKAEAALWDAEPSWRRDIDGVRDFIRRHLRGRYGA